MDLFPDLTHCKYPKKTMKTRKIVFEMITVLEWMPPQADEPLKDKHSSKLFIWSSCSCKCQKLFERIRFFSNSVFPLKFTVRLSQFCFWVSRFVPSIIKIVHLNYPFAQVKDDHIHPARYENGHGSKRSKPSTFDVEKFCFPTYLAETSAPTAKTANKCPVTTILN